MVIIMFNFRPLDNRLFHKESESVRWTEIKAYDVNDDERPKTKTKSETNELACKIFLRAIENAKAIAAWRQPLPNNVPGAQANEALLELLKLEEGV